MIFNGNYFWNEPLKCFRLEGVDSKKFLHGQTSSDIHAVKEGHVIRTCWLSPTGRLKGIIEIKILDGQIYFVILEGNNDEIIDGLNKVIFPFDKVQIIQCKDINRIQEISFDKSWKSSEPQWISFDEKLPSRFNNYQMADDFIVLDWKIRQGFPRVLHEINGKYNPFELGLADMVNLEKGCYLGQETLSKINNSGKIKYQLMFFTSQNQLEEGQSLLATFDKIDQINNLGFLTSFAYSSSSFIGLALIRAKYLKYQEIELADYKGLIRLSKPIGFNSLFS